MLSAALRGNRQIFHHVLWIEVIIASVIFCLIVAVMAFGLFWYRAGRREEASQKKDHKKTERVYLAVVAGVAGFLIYTSLTTNDNLPRGTPAVTVDVTAYQWCWHFTYPVASVQVVGDCIGGHYPTLMVPAGQLVHIELQSADVIHEMWMPAVRFKEMAFPDHVNTFNIVAPKVGAYPSLCDEFCGLYHDRMHFVLRSVAPAAFRAWLGTHRGAVVGGATS